MPHPSLIAAYQQALDQQGFQADEAQWQTVHALQNCQDDLHAGNPQVSGVYLWGPVGRGKTWLMDHFHQGLRVPARRQHFHHFMQWVHRRLFQLTGTADPLLALARELGDEVRVLCFDELFVSDIGDAILLGRLLQALFEQGVTLVATSNQPPQQLYADGFNRERFLPAVTAIEQHMQVVGVDGGQDHRLHPGQHLQRYWVGKADQASALAEVFQHLSRGQASSTQPIILAHRPIPVQQRAPGLVWLNYADLCEQPLAALDFIALCDQFALILLGAVPNLSAATRAAKIARGTEDGVEQVQAGDRQLPALSARDDGVRRFIALVDECYDRKVPLYIEAEVALQQLYTEGHLAFPFRRTLSRLQEMQLRRFADSADVAPQQPAAELVSAD
ncbi:cell division protein ZapE [Pseudomonas sp. J452]|uniref:cell division protein ZapE n=1 Tax=Pseudomonas sp. J452 TaxID=2898441 RepID=UPI0021ADB8C0|nr:cell division protein ZapE [Pseudomonas sp. J452]UUY07997.1 cell division protein ZapE [Pseudomonas sp. J452]